MLALNGFTGKGWIGRQIRLRAVLVLASRLEAALSAPMDMDSCTMGNIITFSDNRDVEFLECCREIRRKMRFEGGMSRIGGQMSEDGRPRGAQAAVNGLETEDETVKARL